MSKHSTIRDKQKKLIDSTIASYKDTNDKALISEFVSATIVADMTRKKKLSDKILVVSDFRMFFFSKNTFKRYQLEADFPYLFLEEIGGANKQIYFKFGHPKSGQMYIVITSDNLSRIVQKVLENYNRITWGWPREFQYQHTNRDFSQVPYPDDSGPAHGFNQTYIAWCNARGTLPRDGLMTFIEDLNAAKLTELDLSLAPGIQARSELAFEIAPLAFALQHNTYFRFRSYQLRDIEQKEVIAQLPTIFQYNRHIKRVVIVNTGGEITEAFGEALQKNKDLQLQILQINGLKGPSKAVFSLARGLRAFPLSLPVLSLRNCSINAHGFTAISNALRSNPGMALTIQELDLSHSHGTNAFLQWINEVRGFSPDLKRLALASMGSQMDVPQLLLDLVTFPLTYLDISDNKIDKFACDSLVSYLEKCKGLETIRIANCALTFENAPRVVFAIANNKDITKIHVDISRNALGPKAAPILPTALSGCRTIIGLDIADNALGMPGLVEVLKGLPPCMERLRIDSNFGESKSDAKVLCQTLVSLLLTHGSLRYLSMCGSSGSRMGRSLGPFFAALSQSTLEELYISGHHCGEMAFLKLCQALRNNSFIKLISCDQNKVELSGYMALYQALNYNQTLLHLELPSYDLSHSKQNQLQLREVLTDIQYLLRGRVAKIGRKDSDGFVLSGYQYRKMHDPFEFDRRWITPTGTPPPHAPVSPDLQNVAVELEKINLEDGEWAEEEPSVIVVSPEPSSVDGDTESGEQKKPAQKNKRNGQLKASGKRSTRKIKGTSFQIGSATSVEASPESSKDRRRTVLLSPNDISALGELDSFKEVEVEKARIQEQQRKQEKQTPPRGGAQSIQAIYEGSEDSSEPERKVAPKVMDPYDISEDEPIDLTTPIPPKATIQTAPMACPPPSSPPPPLFTSTPPVLASTPPGGSPTAPQKHFMATVGPVIISGPPPPRDAPPLSVTTNPVVVSPPPPGDAPPPIGVLNVQKAPSKGPPPPGDTPPPPLAVPPPPPPGGGPPPPPPAGNFKPPTTNANRGALLSSISGFDKKKLAKPKEVNDRSGAII